jgi:hypothetical protein
MAGILCRLSRPRLVTQHTNPSASARSVTRRTSGSVGLAGLGAFSGSGGGEVVDVEAAIAPLADPLTTARLLEPIREVSCG